VSSLNETRSLDLINYDVSLQVELCREITFRNSKQTYKGIPVIASNMDTVGTFEMAKALAKVSMLYQLSKIIYLRAEEWM
jgi:GMP reductase